MGMKFGTEEGTLGPLLLAKFHPISATCRSWGEKPQNRPLSKLNTGGLRAMLPVKRKDRTGKKSQKGYISPILGEAPTRAIYIKNCVVA